MQLLGEFMFLCVCKAVQVSEAVEAARTGVDTADSIRRYFGFDDDECCGRCADDIEAVTQLVHVELKKNKRVAAPSPARFVAVARS